MIFLTGTKCKIRVIYVRFICKRKRGLKMDTLLDFWNCTWKCVTLIVLWYFTVIVTNPKIPPRLIFRHILPVLRSNSRSIVAIKLTIQTPSTFSFHPLYPRSCQHQNNKNSNYFPFVKFHICICLWMGSLLRLFRFLLHFYRTRVRSLAMLVTN